MPFQGQYKHKTTESRKPSHSTVAAKPAKLNQEPGSSTSNQFLQLQKGYGNRATTRLVGQLQRQARVGADGGEAPPHVQNEIERARGGGQSLDSAAASRLGGHLGADFSGVRVHTDAAADSLNRSLSAKAFTTGSDIFFSQGAYHPGTPAGQEILAHELTHVVQQDGNRNAKVQAKLKVGPAQDRYEAEANQMAQAATQPTPGKLATKPSVQRGWIQRLAYTDTPQPDLSIANLTSLSKTASGQEGAYKAQKGNEKVWLKFTDKKDAMQAEYGNMAIKGGTSLVVPGSRYFLKGTTPFNAIAADVTAWSTHASNVGGRIAADAPTDTNKEVVTLMQNLEGRSVEDLALDPARHAPLIAALLRQSVVKDMAEMMVIDAILGNSDRIDRNPKNVLSNIGNFFVTPDFSHLGALDNAAERVGSLNQASVNAATTSLNTKSGMLKDVANPDNVARAVNSLCDACIQVAGANAGQLAAAFTEGFRTHLTHMLTDEIRKARATVVSNLKSNKKTLKTQHAALTTDLQNPELMPNWDTFRIKAKYLELRNKGKADEEAIQQAIDHLGHKNQKANKELKRHKLPVIGKYL